MTLPTSYWIYLVEKILQQSLFLPLRHLVWKEMGQRKTDYGGQLGDRQTSERTRERCSNTDREQIKRQQLRAQQPFYSKL